MTQRSIIIARGVGVVGAVAALVTGITFANLAGSVTLSDNTISTATANLLVYNGSSFQTSATGFTVANLVPGTPSAPQPFYLSNTGGVDLALTATIPSGPTPVGVDPSKVNIIITNSFSGQVINTTLAALEGGNVPFDNDLPNGSQGNSSVLATEGNYTYSVEIDPASIVSTGASVPAFNLVINGTQVGA